MKQIRWMVIALFAAMILLPLAAFERGADVVSAIDNRALAPFPFSAEAQEENGDLTGRIESYVNDRIGFRDDMILGYTVLNDRVFGKMIHPSYCYGQDGYVFFKMGQADTYHEFYQNFADMVVQINDYCRQRDVPFLLAFEPSKTSVLSDKLPEGVNADRGWVDGFLQDMQAHHIPMVDNTGLLREKTAEGVAVFNRKYDAGHWNSIGAYYGVNAMLAAMQEDYPGIRLNDLTQFTVSEELQTSLLVSEFPIQEQTPVVTIPMTIEDHTGDYCGEVELDYQNRAFGESVNPAVSAEDTPKTLVFQGSYMNGQGRKYLENALHDYIYVHNYQNILNFEYYFNLFQPEYVVFEVTEFAVGGNHFDPARLENFCLNPTLAAAEKSAADTAELPLKPESLRTERGEAITKIFWNGETENEAAAWLTVDGTEFDMRPGEDGGWEVSLLNEQWNGAGEVSVWLLSENGVLTAYTG